MKYKIIFTPTAEEQIDEWKKSGNKAVVTKIYQYFAELVNHPTTGTGQVEKLRGYENRWSRRLNKKDRLVYDVIENLVIVKIVTAKGHYDDK
jgi:toxin YoeB